MFPLSWPLSGYSNGKCFRFEETTCENEIFTLSLFFEHRRTWELLVVKHLNCLKAKSLYQGTNTNQSSNLSFFYFFLFSSYSETDQNYYFQSPQRFQSPFPASRNGFFPTNGIPNLVPQPLSRNQLRPPIQPAPIQQQSQEQQAFSAVPKLDGSTSPEYFQYTSFPVSIRTF